MKLADIIASNPIQHYTRNVHDALNDVKDTIDVAAMLSSRRDVFDLLMQQFNTEKLVRRLGKLYTRAIEQRTGILLKGQQLGHYFLLLYNGKDYKSKQLNELKLSSEESIWIDLSQVDLEEVIEDQMPIHRILLRRKKTTPNFLFIADDEENKDNEIYATLNELLSTEQHKLFEANLRLLAQAEFLQQLTQKVIDSLKNIIHTNARIDIDADLYSDFNNNYSPQEGYIKNVLQGYVKATDVKERLEAVEVLCYQLKIRYNSEKVARLIGRNYPEQLIPDQRQIFNYYMQRIICSQTKDIVDYKGTPKYTIEEALKRIDEEIKINKSKMSRKEKAFFDELRRYIKENFLDKRSSQVLLQQNPMANFELQLDQLKNLVATLDEQDATALQRIQTATAPLQAIFGIFKPATPEGAKRKGPEAGEQEQNMDKKPRVDEEEVVGEVGNPISSSLQLQ